MQHQMYKDQEKPNVTAFATAKHSSLHTFTFLCASQTQILTFYCHSLKSTFVFEGKTTQHTTYGTLFKRNNDTSNKAILINYAQNQRIN